MTSLFSEDEWEYGDTKSNGTMDWESPSTTIQAASPALGNMRPMEVDANRSQKHDTSLWHGEGKEEGRPRVKVGDQIYTIQDEHRSFDYKDSERQGEIVVKEEEEEESDVETALRTPRRSQHLGHSPSRDEEELKPIKKGKKPQVPRGKYQMWEPSDSPEESWSDAEGGNENGEWPVEIIGEEVDMLGNVKYEARWDNWQRPDGTNTTWVTSLPHPNLLRSWKRFQTMRRNKLASESIAVKIWPGLDIHNTNTRLRAEAAQEKYYRALKMPGPVEYEKERLRLRAEKLKEDEERKKKKKSEAEATRAIARGSSERTLRKRQREASQDQNKRRQTRRVVQDSSEEEQVEVSTTLRKRSTPDSANEEQGVAPQESDSDVEILPAVQSHRGRPKLQRSLSARFQSPPPPPSPLSQTRKFRDTRSRMQGTSSYVFNRVLKKAPAVRLSPPPPPTASLQRGTSTPSIARESSVTSLRSSLTAVEIISSYIPFEKDIEMGDHLKSVSNRRYTAEEKGKGKAKVVKEVRQVEMQITPKTIRNSRARRGNEDDEEEEKEELPRLPVAKRPGMNKPFRIESPEDEIVEVPPIAMYQPKPTHSRRKELVRRWNKYASVAGAASITIVNEVDDEDAPPLPLMFRYVERGYIYSPGILRAIDDMFVGCECKQCSSARVCGCQEPSEVRDEKGQRIYAYDAQGMFNFQYPVDHMVLECNKQCRCGPDCRNRVAQRPRQVPIEIFKTQYCGWGVRSPVDIPKGRVIGIYTGKVLTREQAETLGEEEKSYCFDLDGQEWVDEEPPEFAFSVNSMMHGNWSRFINHSCMPNLRVFLICYDSIPEMQMPYLAFVALQDIPANTEFTVDYDPAAGAEAAYEALTAAQAAASSSPSKKKGKGKKRKGRGASGGGGQPSKPKEKEKDEQPPGTKRCLCRSVRCRGWVRM